LFEALQTRFASALVLSEQHGCVLTDPAAFHGKALCLFAGQWDETSQRQRSIVKRRLLGERVPYGQKHVQVMMQRGCWAIRTGDEMDDAAVERHPVIMSGLLLESQDANHILDGVMRKMPVPSRTSLR